MSDTSAVVAGDVERLLVVGNSARTAETMTVLAEAFTGSSLLSASTPTGALARLERVDVDCIVCDADDPVQPLLDVIDVTETRTPVVAIATAGEADAALEAGATDVIAPDDSPAVIATRIRNAVERIALRTRSVSARSEGTDETESEPREGLGPNGYRSLLEHSSALVFVLDEDGDVRYASSGVESTIGYTPDELGRRRFQRVVHPDDREDVLETISELADTSLGATRWSTCRLGHADGTWHVADVAFVNRFEDPAVDGIVATVTERMGVDGDPTEGATDVVDRLAYPFFALDENWAVTDVNDAARRLFSIHSDVEFGLDSDSDSDFDPVELEPESRFESETDADIDHENDVQSERERDVRPLLGTVVWDLVPESIRGSMSERIREARTTNSVVEFTTPYPPLETTVEFHVHPGESGVSVYGREAEPEEARTDRDRSRLFETVVDSLEDGVFVLEDTGAHAEHRIELANASLYDLLETDTLVGRRLETLFDDDVVDRISERAASPVVRRTDPIRTDIELEGRTDRPVAISVTSRSADGRAVCVVRDVADRARIRAGLSTLRGTARDFRDATTRFEVHRQLADACAAAVDSEFVCVYRTTEGAFRPTAVAPPEVATVEGLPPIPRGSSIFADAVERDTASVYPTDELEAALDRLGVRVDSDSVGVVVPIDGRGAVFLTLSRSPAPELRAALESVATVAATAIDRLERDSTLRERDRELSRTRETLRQLERFVDCKRRIDRALVRADTRAEIEHAVCESLASIEWVVFSWIGDVNAAAEDVTPRAWMNGRELEPEDEDAGGDASHEYLDRVTVDLEGSVAEPTGRTVETRQPTYVERVVDADPALAWRDEALESGVRSIFSVPLIYDDYVYGVLSLYADRPAAFDDRIRSIVTDLGELVAAAINAVETKRALHTDTVTQLEFAIDDSVDGDSLVSLAREVRARLSIETVVPRPGDRSTVFVNASDTTSEAVRSAAETLDGVETVRIISERDGDVLVELVTDPTLVSVVVDHGGIVRSIEPTDGARFVVELPRGADVREFVHMIERKYPGTRLLARRERTRSVRTREDFRSILGERLTDRQRRALEAAYYSGFFEWPRERTGEEVAESLGVSQPTFNRHFRTAERKVYSLLFDES